MNKITTNSELEDLVDFDRENHKLKEIAVLFLAAMNDWPTFNQTEIHDFIKELKEYFGTPLTVEKINGKKLNMKEAWKHEAGSSIAEMISISAEKDFDKIVEGILNYYQQRI